jgi:menaquinol-cytochrome c reductase iron-sulfur subunit
MTRRSDYYIGRREFVAGVVGLMGAVMAAVVGLPIIGYLVAPALKSSGGAGWVPLGSLSALQPDQPTPFTFSRLQQIGWKRTKLNRTAYVSRYADGDLIVLSDICTHLSCKVRWDPEQEAFACPCHDALFDRLGNVISGPPPRPLDRLEAKVEDDRIFVYVEA